jgi:serine/threonine protein kinase
LLGYGGSSRVFAALDHELARTVAMKLILPVGDGRRASMVRRLRREAEITALLDHSHIVRLFDISEWRGLPFLVMEYLRGKALSQVLDGRPMGPRRALEILLQLARGLDHAHALNVIHRDLKPSNVMLLAEDQVKILDFGLARLGPPVSRHMEVSGTPGYMAPEQWHGSVQDDRTDIWAAGMLTYQMLAGELPYSAVTTRDWKLAVLSPFPVPFDRLFSRNAVVPKCVVDLLGRTLQKRPDDRFQNAQDLIDTIAVALQRVPRASADRQGEDDGVATDRRDVTRTLLPYSSHVDRWGRHREARTGRASFGRR